MPVLRTCLRAGMSLWHWADMSVPGSICSYIPARNMKESARWRFFCVRAGRLRHFTKLQALPPTVEYGRQMLEPCLQHRPRTSAEAAAAQQLHSGVMAVDDPGPKYFLAGWDSLCDQPDLALRELRRAIEQDYCAYPQMET